MPRPGNLMQTKLPILTALMFATASPVLGGEPRGAERIVQSTFKLFNKSSTATCFLVHLEDAPDEPIIVSAAHVFERMEGDHALLVLRKPQPDGGFVRHDHKVNVRDGKKNLWTKHPKLDIAVLRMAVKPGDVPCPSLPHSLLADEAEVKRRGLTVGDRLLVLTYPERFEANDAGFPVARNATIASFPLTPISRYESFLADFTTFGGDSGGPAFLFGEDKSAPLPIVGIVVSKYRHDEKIVSMNEERTVHHPLGIGKVLHAQHVIDTIALATKDKGQAAPQVEGK